MAKKPTRALSQPNRTRVRWGTSLAFCSAFLLSACGDGTPAQNSVQTAKAVRLLSATESVVEAPLSVVKFDKVSETRVSRTVYDYAFKVTVKSASARHGGVQAVLVAVGKGSAILVGTADLGSIAAGATVTSTTTVVIRHDRTYPFDPAAVKFTVTSASINGIAVPADPGATAGATVVGIDANQNGVRDEVDRALALSYGDNPRLYTAVSSAAATEQRWLTAGALTEAQAQTYVLESIASAGCLRTIDTSLGRTASQEVSLRTFNTSARMEARQRVLDRAGAFEIPMGEPSC